MDGDLGGGGGGAGAADLDGAGGGGAGGGGAAELWVSLEEKTGTSPPTLTGAAVGWGAAELLCNAELEFALQRLALERLRGTTDVTTGTGAPVSSIRATTACRR